METGNWREPEGHPGNTAESVGWNMRKERRKIKHIKMDLARSYSGMESKVDARAREVFKRKPYTAMHA